jgi:hypothetical protein
LAFHKEPTSLCGLHTTDVCSQSTFWRPSVLSEGVGVQALAFAAGTITTTLVRFLVLPTFIASFFLVGMAIYRPASWSAGGWQTISGGLRARVLP